MFSAESRQPGADSYNIGVLLCYITDRRQFPGDEAEKRRALLAKIAEAARCGVDFIQLREKDLPTRDLESLAREAVQTVRENSGHAKLETRNSKLLINSRTDVALATGADGVHLPANDLSASEARAIWDAATRNALETGNRKLETSPATGDWRPATPIIAASCHSLEEILAAESHGADFAVFGPVFEKVQDPPRPGLGLAALRQACHRMAAPDPKVESVASGRMPVLALGGVTLENARACLQAGAAGVAAIRLFQENDVLEIVAKLRGPAPAGG